MAWRTLRPEQAEHVRDLLRELETRAGGSKTKLAQMLGIAQPSVSNILSGKTTPSYPTAETAAKLLGLQLDAALRGERLPLASVRSMPGYEETRAKVAERFSPAVLDAATRILDAVPVAVILPENLTEAARFAERWWPSTEKLTGATLRLAGAIEDEKKRTGKKRERAKGG